MNLELDGLHLQIRDMIRPTDAVTPHPADDCAAWNRE
jgi:hypothetical protein